MKNVGTHWFEAEAHIWYKRIVPRARKTYDDHWFEAEAHIWYKRLAPEARARET